ncbi:MAG: hypothetical protein ABJN69_03680 [Hellea sp.]
MSKTENKIIQLYNQHDRIMNSGTGVVKLPPVITRRGKELLGDIEAVLEIPQNRAYVEATLEEALSRIASRLLGPENQR